jgi:hypothetical protein
MKRLLFFCIIMIGGYTLSAQDIQVRKIKKIPVSNQNYFPSFAQKSHEILLSGADRKVSAVYNTRWRREKTFSGSTALEATAVQPPVSVQVDMKTIKITRPGSGTVSLAPLGDYFYVWASLSPDGEKLLFTAAGKGSYISDLEGNIISELGALNDPTWINNQWVLGMDDRDDGHQVETSDVISVHVSSGLRKNLTAGSQVIAMYPRASRAANRVAFRNPQGELFTMKINIKE